MKKFTKGFIALPLLLATVSSMIVSPIRDAHALVGLIAASTPTLVVGGLLTAVGAAGLATVYTLPQDHGPDDGLRAGLLFLLVVLPFGGAGLIVLDAQNGQNVSFQELQSADAAKFGVSQVELEAYNAEAVDRLNLIAQDAASAISAAPKGEEEIASANAWSTGLKGLSPDALSAVHKIFTKKN